MKKVFALFFIAVSLLFLYSPIILAHNRSEHDKEMEAVLFGGRANKEQKEAAKALEAAAYLTIDQFGGDGQKNLDLLADYVNDLPELEEIDISRSETSHHREYTHIRDGAVNIVIFKGTTVRRQMKSGLRNGS